jgi:protocatechuate 4,5-dioxygenase alpha subunit
MRQPHDYDDIPGTTVFDAERSRQGFHLNQFCMSLMKADNRAAFLADEPGYLQRFPQLTRARSAVVADIYAGLATSHVPAIGAAIDLGKTREPYCSRCSQAMSSLGAGS